MALLPLLHFVISFTNNGFNCVAEIVTYILIIFQVSHPYVILNPRTVMKTLLKLSCVPYHKLGCSCLHQTYMEPAQVFNTFLDKLLGRRSGYNAQCAVCKVYFSAQLNKLRPILNLKKYYPIQHIFVPACSSARKIHFFKF